MVVKRLLTPKQEKFCQCIVSGMDNQTSYMTAYDCNSTSAANVESTKLLKRDDITQRINELRKPIVNLIQNKAISEREKIKKILWSRLDLAISNNDDTNIIKIADIINKMNSEYINVNHNIEDTATDINNLDTDTLMKLSKLN